MNPDFKKFMLEHLDIDNKNINDTSILNEISNNDSAYQIIQLYIETVRNLNLKQVYKSILIDYLKWFEFILEKNKYDILPKKPNRIFAHTLIYTEKLSSYTYFDIDYCSSILRSTKIYTSAEIGTKNIFHSERPTSMLRPIDWHNPIILAQVVDEPDFVIIDGNHRYKNAIRQNLSLPCQILTYDSVTPKCFINNFNYLLFLFRNEFKRIYSLCSSNYNTPVIIKQIEDYKLLVNTLLETQ